MIHHKSKLTHPNLILLLLYVLDFQPTLHQQKETFPASTDNILKHLSASHTTFLIQTYLPSIIFHNSSKGASKHTQPATSRTPGILEAEISKVNYTKLVYIDSSLCLHRLQTLKQRVSRRQLFQLGTRLGLVNLKGSNLHVLLPNTVKVDRGVLRY